MYVCILDAQGQVLVHENLRSDPGPFLEAIEPYREGLVVAVECIFTWYWLADLCAREGIAFVLGHALYKKAIHGGKAKNDRIDAFKIATLLRGGMLPQAYAYPAGMRAIRDLLRRRLRLVRKRGQLLAREKAFDVQRFIAAARRGRASERARRPTGAQGSSSNETAAPPSGIDRDEAPVMSPGIRQPARLDWDARSHVLTTSLSAVRLCPSPEPGDNGSSRSPP